MNLREKSIYKLYKEIQNKILHFNIDPDILLCVEIYVCACVWIYVHLMLSKLVIVLLNWYKYSVYIWNNYYSHVK